MGYRGADEDTATVPAGEGSEAEKVLSRAAPEWSSTGKSKSRLMSH